MSSVIIYPFPILKVSNKSMSLANVFCQLPIGNLNIPLLFLCYNKVVRAVRCREQQLMKVFHAFMFHFALGKKKQKHSSST